LGDQPKLANVLKLAADKAGWGTPLPAGVGRGIAVAESFHSAVAHVAEIRMNSDGTVKVERMVCAIDCGVPVNPDVIKAQMEGGAGYALSAVVHGGITLTDGVVDQSNFDSYAPLRITEMPKVEVYIVPSNGHPTGVGEPGVPPVAPAVMNAVLALTGKEIGVFPI
jgi:isoquinoline 1-oxidoreductase beta subunit